LKKGEKFKTNVFATFMAAKANHYKMDIGSSSGDNLTSESWIKLVKSCCSTTSKSKGEQFESRK
jgi:hypothetical protein